MKGKKSIYIIFSVIIFICGLFDYNSFLNQFEYYIYLLFLIVLLMQFLRNKIFIPSNYLFTLSAYITSCIITYIISPYTQNIIYFAIGLIFSILPFIHYILSYGYKFNDEKIARFINALIVAVAFIDFITIFESYVFHSAIFDKRLIGTSIFWFQYLASANNQVLILSIALYKLSGKKIYKYLIIFFAVYAIFTLQLKTYVGLVVIIILYSIVYSNKNKFIKLFSATLFLIIAFFALMQVDPVSKKVNAYVDMYYINTDGIARNELYNASFMITKDYFPFGVGQGTFGSIPVNMYDSKVYHDYNLSNVYGLSYNSENNYKMDTHWSSVLGENGLLGTYLYLLLFLHPVCYIRKYKKKFKEYYFVIIACISVLAIESLVLNLISRLVFIMIYSGLTSIIVRRISDNNKTAVIL